MLYVIYMYMLYLETYVYTCVSAFNLLEETTKDQSFLNVFEGITYHLFYTLVAVPERRRKFECVQT